MKAKLSIIITAACFIAGCSSEKTIDIDKGTPDENGMVYMEFSSGAPIVENNSRTQLGDNFSVLWSDGDNISVFSNEGVSYKFTENNISGPSSSAVFGGMITEGVGETFALYPYNATAVDSTGGNGNNAHEFINTYIPAFQTIPAGGYDPKACVSVAKLNFGTQNPSGVFKLACGLVGFSLTNPDFVPEGVKKVKEIRISLVDTENADHVHLAGNAKIDVTDFNNTNKPDEPVEPRITYGLYNAHSITLRSASGLFEDNQMYYICLPELSNVPVNFSFILENDKFYNRKVYISSKRAVKDAFKGVLELRAEYFTATQTTDISTVEQFIAWYSNPAAIYGTVNIIENLDFSKEETGALKCHDFYGTFNGNGKTLKGLKMQPSTDGMVGLFANVNSATVSDVTIDNMIVNGAGTTIEYAGGIGAYVRSNAHITGCNVINTKLSATDYCGGIAGKADRSVIDGCTSKTNTLNSNKTGALVGELGASCTVEASYSVGTQLEQGSSTGAIVGFVYAAGNNIVSCYSDASFSNKTGAIYGGITKNIKNDTSISESYYIGSVNISKSDDNFALKITSLELKNKKDAMNSALETSGSNYIFTDGTGNEPLTLTK